MNANIRTCTEKEDKTYRLQITQHTLGALNSVCVLFIPLSLLFCCLLPPPPTDISLQLVICWREVECDNVIIHADMCRWPCDVLQDLPASVGVYLCVYTAFNIKHSLGCLFSVCVCVHECAFWCTAVSGCFFFLLLIRHAGRCICCFNYPGCEGTRCLIPSISSVRLSHLARFTHMTVLLLSLTCGSAWHRERGGCTPVSQIYQFIDTAVVSPL